MRVKVTEIYVCIYVVVYTAAASAADDDNDDLGVLGPFQHYLNHIETIEG